MAAVCEKGLLSNKEGEPGNIKGVSKRQQQTHGPRSWCWSRSVSEHGGPERAWTDRTEMDSRHPLDLETPASSPRSLLSP